MSIPLAYIMAITTLLLVTPPSIVVHVESTGIVNVYMLVTLEPGINTIQLPVEPILATLEVTINGTPVTPVYDNGSLYVLSETKAVANITYIAMIAETDGVLSFNISSRIRVTMVFDPNIVLLSLPKNILDTRIIDGRLVVVIEGPEHIEYIVKQVTMTTLPTTSTQQTMGAPTSPTTTISNTVSQETIMQEATEASMGGTTTEAPPPQTLPMILAVLGLVMAAVIAVVVILRRHSGERVDLGTGLDDIDKAILELLAKSGGSMLQSEIQKQLNLPKTTAWRRIRKLEKLGYVEIRKEPTGLNRVILRKH